ncbi:MAG: hypothetical protein LUE93_06180, partial [Bacteroides sp.]|nr:hypothetical protein [Bacteroides sp.]
SFIGLFLYSCGDENLIEGGNTLDLGEEIEVTFGYSVSGISLVESRGVIVPEEIMNTITEGAVDVLVYGIDEEGDEAFSYHRKVFDHIHNGASGTFKVRLAKSREGEKYSIDFLFNLSVNILNTALFKDKYR